MNRLMHILYLCLAAVLVAGVEQVEAGGSIPLNVNSGEHLLAYADQPVSKSIAGMSVGSLGYKELYHYALSSRSLLWTFGLSSDGKPTLAIHDIENGRRVASYSFDRSNRSFMHRLGFLLFKTTLSLDESATTYAVVVHKEGNVARDHEETTTYLDIFSLSGAKSFQRIAHQEIGTTDIVAVGNSEREYIFRYLAYDYSQTGPYVPRAGVLAESRILIQDLNSDHDQDILVWTREYSSRTFEEKAKTGLKLSREYVRVMYYQPKGDVFQDPEIVGMESLPCNSDKLWDQLFPGQTNDMLPIPR